MISGAKKLGVRLLVGLLVVAMAAFGLESFLLSGSTRGALEINGEPIYQAQIDAAANNYRNELASTYGQEFVEQISPEIITNSATSQLTQRTLLRQKAQALGLEASDTMVNQVLVRDPTFQIDGRFSAEALQGFLTSNRVTLSQVQDDLRGNLGREVLIESVASSQTPHAGTLDLVAGLLYARFDVVSVDLSTDRIAQGITPSAEQIEDYYADNASDYVQPAKASFDYVLLDLANYINQAPDPTEEALSLAYQDYLAEQEDQAAYEVSHILVGTDSRSNEEATALAVDLRQRIEQGADFAALAEEFSDDPGSSSKGGSLGAVNPDSLVPEFADQLRLLAVNEISQPVQSDFGYHIIRLDSNPEDNQPTLDDMREQLVDTLKRAEARKLYDEAVAQLRNLTQGATGLDAAIGTLGVELQTSAMITRADASETEAGSVLGETAVIDAAFDDAVITQGQASEVVDIGDQAIVLLLKDYTPERQPGIEEVQDDIARATTIELANQQTQALAQSMAALSVPEDKPVDWLLDGQFRQELNSQDQSVDTQVVRQLASTLTFTQRQDFPRLPPEDETDPATNDLLRQAIVSQSITLNSLQYREAQGQYVIYMLSAITKPRFEKLTPSQQQNVRRIIASNEARVLSAQLLALLQQEADISDLR